MRVLVLNGPNLGRLGAREPDVYGFATHDDLVATCRRVGQEVGLDVEVRQTDSEPELIGWLHEAADGRTPVVLNPAAFTHYSYALRDACAQLTAPLVEVHLTNPATRETFRHTSVIAGVATGTISGFGLDSYRLALRAIASVRDDARRNRSSPVSVAVHAGPTADVEAAAAIWCAADDARRRAIGLAARGSVAESANTYAERLVDPDTRLFLASDGEQVVGMALSMAGVENEGAGPGRIPGVRHLSAVAVLPSHWRSGIGTALVRAVVDDALDEQQERLQLFTHETNRAAQAIYRACGFRPSDRVKTDDGGEPIRRWDRLLA